MGMGDGQHLVQHALQQGLALRIGQPVHGLARHGAHAVEGGIEGQLFPDGLLHLRVDAAMHACAVEVFRQQVEDRAALAVARHEADAALPQGADLARRHHARRPGGHAHGDAFERHHFTQHIGMAYAVLQAQEVRVRPDEMGNALQRGPRMGRLGEDQPQRGPCRELLGPRGMHAGLQQPLIGVAARAIAVQGLQQLVVHVDQGHVQADAGQPRTEQGAHGACAEDAYASCVFHGFVSCPGACAQATSTSTTMGLGWASARSSTSASSAAFSTCTPSQPWPRASATKSMSGSSVPSTFSPSR